MPQSNVFGNQVDATGNLLMALGSTSKLNILAAGVVKAGPGRICRVFCLATGAAGGALTINDCATTGTAATANQIFSVAFGGITLGAIFTLDIPCSVGITVSAIPTGGTPQFAITYD
jgi:hypothetical protein